MTARPWISPQELLRTYPADVRARAEALRALVKQAAPGVDEVVYSGWQAITYVYGREICSIMPFFDHVDLLFHEGGALPDPEGLLVGEEGRSMRRLRIDAGAPLGTAALVALIQAAVERAR